MTKPRRRTQEERGEAVPGAPQNVGDTTAAAPDRDRVAQRAYELYQARGGDDGRAMDDWLDAERELNQQPGSRIEE